MRKMKLIALAAALITSISAFSIQAQASDYVTISDYTESFTPDGSDGKMEVSVTGEAGEDGYLYLMQTVKEMEPVAVTGENLEGTELEAYAEGSINFFRIKVADASAPATVNAEFRCSGFYDFAKKAETNGGENSSVAYKFTNQLKSKIGSYHVQISIPEGKQIIAVTKPAAYEDYELSEINGMRTVGYTKAAAPAAAIDLAFTFGTPFVSTMAGKVAVWVICLGIGTFVLVDRYRKATKEDSAE